MKTLSTMFLAALFAVGISSTAVAQGVQQKQPGQDFQQTETGMEKEQGMPQAGTVSTDEILGKQVFSNDGEEIGEIESLQIDQQNGRVSQAVLAIDGFMGLGEEQASVSWAELNPSDQGYRINKSKQEVLDAAEAEQAAQPESQEQYQPGNQGNL